jgi:thiol-disulfide isomerase/thioredoxin
MDHQNKDESVQPPVHAAENDTPVGEPVSGPGGTGPGEGLPGEGGPPPTRRRWIVSAMAALAVMLFAVPFLRGPANDEATVASGTSPAGGAATCSAGKANFDFTMKDMHGADVRLSDFKGKVVLLNFWATWCGPCKVEIPEFVEVYREYKDRGFEILGVLAMDDPSAADLQAFASTYKMNYPVFRANEDFENAHGPLWGLPTSLVINRDGAICQKHMGPVSRATLEQEIKGLL